ncbi:MAG TPA: GNAT family protein [Acidimicrobiales bacterium]|nr:GNAT family protein [Acidimicrobiales bacterium]
MIGFPEPKPLSGVRARLEPLGLQHAQDLAIAAEEDRGAYNFTWVPRGDNIDEYVEFHLDRAAKGISVPYAIVRLADGMAVGSTAYFEPRYWPGTTDRLRALEVGFTWLGASAIGKGINGEAKLLLMRHAFEDLGVARVDFKTDARNERSRRALAAIGATFEGTLRRWSQSWAPGEEGGLRDSAMFSVIAEEWPSCEAALAQRLSGTAR